MRKFLLTLFAATLCIAASAQTPQAVKYQAVARDDAGNVYADRDLGFRISIVQTDPDGPSVYVETHNVTSNEFGLVNLNVGRGTVISGDFSNIDWASGIYFMRVEMDVNGGGSYEIMGTSQLLAVPYAFHAGSADNVDDADADPTNELITRLELVGAGLVLEEGGVTQTVDLTALINDADANPNNELITAIQFRNDSIVITEGGVERGVEITGFFSGDYNDLINRPNFQDSINTHGFDGDYFSLTNRPSIIDSINTFGFDGDYNNLTNRPDIEDSINALGVITNVDYRNDSIVITEGGIEQGVEITGFFSGDYGDLTNTPDFQDSINTYGFSGDYNDLINRPSFQDSINTYGFDGDYFSLTNRPSIIDSINAFGFDGSYNSLTDVPNFADTVNTYGFSGDYNDLINRPDIKDTVDTYGVITNVDYRNDSIVITEGGIEQGVEITGFFSGDYGDLTNTPDFQDSINTYGFDGNYNSLADVPSFADTVMTYGFDGDYNSLANVPSFEDTVSTYGFDGSYNSLADVPSFADTVMTYGFDGDYNSLANVPSFEDTVNTYGFDGSYNSLADVPNFADTVVTYGFSGDYNDLANRPDIEDSINALGVITSATFNNDSLFITEGGVTFDVDLTSLQGAPQDLQISNDTLTITDHPTATSIDLTPYRSKWNENGSGDLFSHRNIGLGVESPQFKLHLLDTLTPGSPSGAFIRSYFNDGAVPTRSPALEVEMEGTTNNTHVGIRTRSIGVNTDGFNHALRTEAVDGSRNIGAHILAGVNNATTNNFTNYAIYSEVGKSTAQNNGVFNEITEPTGGLNVSVWGRIVGNSPVANGFIIGGYFDNRWENSGSNYGVWGEAGRSSNLNVGLFGRAITPTATGTNYGVLSVANGSDNENIAIYGQAPQTAGSGLHLAGKFEGDVEIDGDLNVTGNIAKGSGTFRIDHPMDPLNKELVHSFVESPDMMNVYNGNVTTDANGYATVELPEYFEEVNKDFRYQLTVVGVFAQAIVKEKISNNRFVIQTDQPHVEVSWQVTGIRNDPYARKNRIQPERQKEDRKRGKYIHPEVYGVRQEGNSATSLPTFKPDKGE